MLHVARWKYRMQKIAKNSPSWHHHTTLSGYIFATKAHIDNREKKPVKQQCLPHTFSQYGELRPTSGWDLLARSRHPCKFQCVSRPGNVTARHSSSGRQPKFTALNTGRHLHWEGQPSRLELAHILVLSWFITFTPALRRQYVKLSPRNNGVTLYLLDRDWRFLSIFSSSSNITETQAEMKNVRRRRSAQHRAQRRPRPSHRRWYPSLWV